jgi:hypothetical protein
MMKRSATFALKLCSVATAFAIIPSIRAFRAETCKDGRDCRPSSINGVIYVDGHTHASLHSALLACPGNGCAIIDNLPAGSGGVAEPAWTTDPFLGINKAVVVQLGPGVWKTNTPVNVCNVCRLIGAGRANQSNTPTLNTTIQATASFAPADAAIVKLNGTQGTTLEHLGVDCNGFAPVGIYATDINEQGGIWGAVVENCPTYGINVDASKFSVIPAQNYIVRDVECFGGAVGTLSTICVHLKGNGGGGPAIVENITASGSGEKIIGGSLAVENFNTAVFTNIHGEDSRAVFKMMGSGVSFITINNLTAGPPVNGGQILLDIPKTVTGGGWIFSNLVKNGASVLIEDPQRLAHSNTDPFMGEYVVGTGELGHQEIRSTNFSVPREIIGNLSVQGTVKEQAGAFQIDNPLDPSNQYLEHSFVGSPDMMDIYNGVVQLDEKGEGTVMLPSYFESLNRDYRYQLTCIGGFAPVYIAQEIDHDSFRIAGGKPGVKVSWQITGIRRDSYANANRIPEYQEK